MTYTYEIFLRRAHIGKTEWNEFLSQVANFLKYPSSWKVILQLEQNTVHYYLQAPRPVPASFSLIDFLVKPCNGSFCQSSCPHCFYSNKWSDDFISVYQNLYRRQCRLIRADITLHSTKKVLAGHIKILYRQNQRIYSKRLLLFSPSAFLSIDFEKSKAFLYKKFPKYLKLEKVTRLLTSSHDNAILEIDPFPYLSDSQFLQLKSYDFTKHSLVIGGSGSGKSRFLASIVHKISQLTDKDYKIVVIDPHDAFYQDCTGIESTQVINFQAFSSSINLFSSNSNDLNSSVELMLLLFRSLINNDYNGRLERVLRYSTYLLAAAQEFSFIALRKLLLDPEYRNRIVAKYQAQVPSSVAHFFLADFNELRTQNYNDAIAPIISFIDEMQMVPVFNLEKLPSSLSESIQQNFLSIFSLSRLKLGTKVVQTIAGLLMQQLFLFAQQNSAQNLIIIIDEVAVIENPIIARFLSELRKYHTSVILAGQYFDQISPQLRSAIFANISNYYLFRTSQSDAELLTRNLKIQIEGSDNIDDSQKMLTKLAARECLVQISAADELLPIFKAHTTDYEPIKTNNCTNEQLFDYPKNILNLNNMLSQTTSPSSDSLSSSPPSSFTLDIDDVDLSDFTNSYTTNRKPKE